MAATGGKAHLGIVIVGHVDAGKSTTTGHLLFELGGLDDRTLDKLKAEAKALGKESFVYAFFLDKGKDERARGVTIAVTTKEFFTDSYHYTIIDAPGHRDFIKNMIAGAAQADVALLMVPADSNFEKSIAKGNHKKGEVQGQTRQHARLCHLIGIDQMIVGINKMDATKPTPWNEDRYNEIKGEVDKMITKIGYKTKKIPFIPMSGWTGDNLVKESDNMPWWKGNNIKVKKEKVLVKTLYDCLEKVVKPPKRDPNKPFRMPVSGIYKIKGVGDVITGRIEQGVLNTKDEVSFAPTGVAGKAFSIEMHHKPTQVAGAGDNVGVSVKGLDKEKMPRTGDVMYLTSDAKPPVQVTKFTAMCFVQEHPGQLKAAKDGKGGFTPSIHVRTAKAPCQLVQILWKQGKSTGNAKVANPPYVEAGDSCEVVMAPKMPICLAPYDECKPLARIAAMDSNSLVMLGKVTSVEKKEI